MRGIDRASTIAAVDEQPACEAADAAHDRF
jgi:hypothetical protein